MKRKKGVRNEGIKSGGTDEERERERKTERDGEI